MSALTSTTVPAPTPWRWTTAGKPTGKSLARYHIYVEDKDGRKIAAVWGKDFEREATANLMVAAPALRDALRAVIRVADRKTVEFDSARAALAMLDDDQGAITSTHRDVG